MQRVTKRIFAVILAAAICISVLTISVSARSSWYLNSYCAWINVDGNGELSVTVDVQATGDMDEIGATEILVLESKDDGDSWTEYRKFLPVVFPEMLKTDTFIYYDTPVSFEGTPGYDYCAIVTVYAGDSTGSDSREYTTPMVTAR